MKKLFWILILIAAASCRFTPNAGKEPEEPGKGEYERSTSVRAGSLQVVHEFNGQFPIGVAVSGEGRIFISYPRWQDQVEFTVAELKDGKEDPYPNAELNKPNGPDKLFSVQSVRIDPEDRLWILDTGSQNMRPVKGQKWPKLVGVDLKTNKVFKIIHFPKESVLSTTYLNDIRFDLKRGREGMAFLTDSSLNGPNAIIVVDLASGKSWRKLNNHSSVRADKTFAATMEGKPLVQNEKGKLPRPIFVGADGIAASSDGARLFYCPLSSRTLYSVSIDALADPDVPDAQAAKTIKEERRDFASDGLESDSAGRIYLTDWEHNAIVLREPDGRYSTLVNGPELWWPDTMSLAADGNLYISATQIHRLPRFNNGVDRREKPFKLFKLRLDAMPIMR